MSNTYEYVKDYIENISDSSYKLISTNYVNNKQKLEMIEYAKQYLNSGHHYIKFDIDNNIIINSQGEFDYDFGELRMIKKDNIIFKEELN